MIMVLLTGEMAILGLVYSSLMWILYLLIWLVGTIVLGTIVSVSELEPPKMYLKLILKGIIEGYLPILGPMKTLLMSKYP